MDENRSLTDFATGGEGSSSDDSDVEDDAEVDGDAGDEADATESEAEPSEGGNAEPVDSAVSTYRWSAEGEACADCGETVERRWRDGDAYVCGDCKEW